MKLGCQTHFQNNSYPLSLFTQLKQLGVDFIRDEIAWHYVETTKGTYTFPSQILAYMAAAQSAGIEVLYTADFTNPLYDDDKVPYTTEGRAAFTSYILAVLRQFPQIQMLEVWNEPDSATFWNGPAAFNPSYYYFLLLDTVHTAVKAAFPNVQIFGGVTSAQDIPYIRELTAWGANRSLDVFSLHPYAFDEQIPWYLSKVRQVRAGGLAACTEWGQITDLGVLVRGFVLQAASGAVLSSWYQGYGSAGSLMTTSGLTDTGEAFSFLKSLMGSATPARVTSAPDTYIYRLETDTYAIWGRYPRGFTAIGNAFDTKGQPMPMPTTTSFEPIFLTNCTSLKPASSPLFIDNSRVNFGGPNWQYLSDRGASGLVPATLMQYGAAPYTECYGDALHTPYFQITNGNVVEPYGAAPVLRWTAPTAHPALTINGYVSVPNAASTGCSFSILHNGAPIYAATISGASALQLTGLSLAIAAGDTLDFRYSEVNNNPAYSNFLSEINLTA